MKVVPSVLAEKFDDFVKRVRQAESFTDYVQVAYISIGNNCSLKNCNIENSILMADCKIDAKIHLVDSIIAHAVEVEDHHMPKKHQFLLGERSHIRL